MRKYGSDKQLDLLVKSINYEDKIEAINQGYGLDVLINDKNEQICRKCIQSDAWPEFCDNNWETLIHHPSIRVRAAVAEQGYGLNILIKDEDPVVRRAVAEQGYGLNILIKDKDLRVRAAVAEQGYKLNKLIKDKEWLVRREIAKQGYKLNTLINDSHYEVCQACIKSDIWPEFVANNWEDLVYHINDEIRKSVAKLGYGLDILINDEVSSVRAEVVKKGYKLDVLINDHNSLVKTTAKEYITKHGYKSIEDWLYNKDQELNSFIQKLLDNIESSSNLKVQSDVDDLNTDTFQIIILDLKNKIELVKLTKSHNIFNYRLHLITNDNIDVVFNSNFCSKNELEKLLHTTIEELKNYDEFIYYSELLQFILE